MHRRNLLVALAAWPASAAFAHHGWSSFDQGRPLYLDGFARKVAWRNPHVEFDPEVAADLKVPPDLARRPVPAQAAAVDGARLMASARTPNRRVASPGRSTGKATWTAAAPPCRTAPITAMAWPS